MHADLLHVAPGLMPFAGLRVAVGLKGILPVAVGLKGCSCMLHTARYRRFKLHTARITCTATAGTATSRFIQHFVSYTHA